MFYSKRFCLKCAVINAKEFPAEIQMVSNSCNDSVSQRDDSVSLERYNSVSIKGDKSVSIEGDNSVSQDA